MSSDPIEVLRSLPQKWRDESGPVDQIYRLLPLEQSGAEKTHACADELESALASLSSPKPESAEAVCPECKGEGSIPEAGVAFGAPVICPDCAGSGRAEHSITANESAPPRPEATWKVLEIGARGSAYDPPNTRRAFTYEHQPGNMLASHLGRATKTAANASAGDSIDRGLILLKALQEKGFGVFQIEPSTAAPQQASAPVGVEGLPRYGFPNGDEPRPVPCADGYWTPWHLAQQPAAVDGARPLSEWHEDLGPVTWWKLPIDEPAWIGSPTDDDWPGYHTHWTPHPACPANAGQQQGGES